MDAAQGQPPTGVGHFWVLADEHTPITDANALPGHLKLDDDGWLDLTLLPDGGPDFSPEPKRNPVAIVGSLTDSSVMLLEILDSGGTGQYGNHRAHTRRYRARTALRDVPFTRLKTLDVTRLEAHFQGLGEWFELSGSVESHEQDERGRATSWSVTLKRAPPHAVNLVDGIALEFSTTWTVRGSTDNRDLRAPVTMSSIAPSPRPIWDLLSPLLAVRDLASLAWECLLTTSNGACLPDLGPGPEGKPRYDPPSYECWNAALAVARPGRGGEASDERRGMFYPSWFGGYDGIERWIRLCADHPRAVQPLVSRHRSGLPSSYARILDLAAAFEYWALVKRQESGSSEPFNRAMALLGGQHFDQWCGGWEAWARLFTQQNRVLKHDPNGNLLDPFQLSNLAESAWLLLLAVVLCEIAGNDTPARGIFDTNVRTLYLGQRITEMLSAGDAQEPSP